MDFNQAVKNEYPYPIASKYLKLSHIDEEDYGSQHDELGDLFEITLKFLSVISLQDFKVNGKVPEYLSDFLKKMLHPSLGHWNEIIRTISSEDLKTCYFAQEISNFYKAKASQKAKESSEELQSLLHSKINIKTYKEVFDLLILYRNKAKGHGAKISKTEYKERVDILNVIIFDILEHLKFIKDYDLYFVEEIQVLPTKEYKHKIKTCSGAMIEPSSFVKEESLLPKHLYIAKNVNDKDVIIDLHPLITLYFSNETKNEQIFIFNDYRKNRLEYLCYTTGHFHYPEMLPSEFEDFFKVSLSQIDTSQVGEISDSEAIDKASQLFSNAMKKVITKQYYEALEYLQYSNSLNSTWEANHYSALILMVLGSSPTEILFHINACEQIEPDNSITEELKNKLDSILQDEESIKKPSPEQRDKIKTIAKEHLDEEVYSPSVKPVYYYLTPPKLRDYYKLFWTVIPVVLLILRIIVADMIELEQNIFVQAVKIAMVLSFFFIINYIVKSIPDFYFAFLQQLPEKSKDYFKEWFELELNKTFGNFNEEKTLKKSINISDKNNRRYFTIFFILYFMAVIGAIYLTCYDNIFSIQALFVAFDYLVMWLVFVLGVPILISTYNLLKDYSLFPLKPIISKVNLLSIQRIGKIIMIVSLPWTFDYFALTIIGYLSFSVNVVFIQLSLFYFMVGVGCIWTLVTPIYFINSLSKSKERTISKYSEHIETSFNRLIENPTEENLEKYHWLKKQQGEFLNIKTNPLSWSTKMSIYLVNIFIIVTALLYPFAKWRITLDEVISWFSRTFLY